MTEEKRLEIIEQEIEELLASLPAHSIPTAMLLRLEELEEELEQLKSSLEGESSAAT